MTEVISPSTTSPSPSPLAEPSPEASDDTHPLPSSSNASDPRTPLMLERIPSYAQSRVSSYSQRASRSRPASDVYPAFQSTLPYALVRDFAYPAYHLMHYGATPDSPSDVTTPSSDWNPGRRFSASAEGTASQGVWSTGPWGGDGAMYGDSTQELESLPSTSFGSEDRVDEELGVGKRKHRKSRSYTNMSDFERGRRRASEQGNPRTRDMDMFHFSGAQHADPGGRDNLRQIRGYGGSENGGPRRESQYSTTLPSRSYHTSQTMDLDSDMPLDAEYSTHSPQRHSLGPDDEELFAGPSLALYNFQPENPNELRLSEGQTILVSYRHGQGWLVAEDPQSGEQGLVPEEYVRLLKHIENWDMERGRFIDDDEEEEYEDEEDEEDDGEKGAEEAEARSDSLLTGKSQTTVSRGPGRATHNRNFHDDNNDDDNDNDNDNDDDDDGDDDEVQPPSATKPTR